MALYASGKCVESVRLSVPWSRASGLSAQLIEVFETRAMIQSMAGLPQRLKSLVLCSSILEVWNKCEDEMIFIRILVVSPEFFLLLSFVAAIPYSCTNR